MLRRFRSALLPALAVACVYAPAAFATPEANIQNELAAGGVAAPAVTLATPPPATAADVAAVDADPSSMPASMTYENMLSPDPTAPLPVATVTFTFPSAAPLRGLISTPGTFALTDSDAEAPLWEMQVLLALKHEIARGTSIAGVALKHTGDAQPYAYTALPSADRSGVPPPTLSTAAVKQQVQDALPAWAASATVTVSNWTGGERRVSVAATMEPQELAANDVRGLIASLMGQQADLNTKGGGVGSVVLEIDSPIFPAARLVTFAGDADWRESFLFVHPMVRAWAQGGAMGAAGSLTDSAQDTAGNVTSNPTGVTGMLP